MNTPHFDTDHGVSQYGAKIQAATIGPIRPLQLDSNSLKNALSRIWANCIASRSSGNPEIIP
jgi:hypothetical protein